MIGSDYVLEAHNIYHTTEVSLGFGKLLDEAISLFVGLNRFIVGTLCFVYIWQTNVIRFMFF